MEIPRREDLVRSVASVRHRWKHKLLIPSALHCLQSIPHADQRQQLEYSMLVVLLSGQGHSQSKWTSQVVLTTLNMGFPLSRKSCSDADLRKRWCWIMITNLPLHMTPLESQLPDALPLRVMGPIVTTSSMLSFYMIHNLIIWLPNLWYTLFN